MNKKLLVARDGDKKCAAVIENGVLTELLCGNAEKPQISGNIYLGRVENVLPGMNAAFVNIGLNRTAFMSGDDMPEGKIGAGNELPVQIVKLTAGDKGMLVSAKVKPSGRTCVLMPYENTVGISKRINDDAERERLHTIALKYKPADCGLIMRTNAAQESEEALKADIEALNLEWQNLRIKAGHLKAPLLLRDYSSIPYRAARDMFDADTDEVIFSEASLMDEACECVPELRKKARLYTGETDLLTLYKVRKQTETELSRKVWLKSGGFLVFDKTEALTVIDVNTGTFTGKNDPVETFYQINMEAAAEIAVQLRLRDIGGIVIVDFVDMQSKSQREGLLKFLSETVACDKGRTKVIDMTALGLMELTRKRKNEELQSFF